MEITLFKNRFGKLAAFLFSCSMLLFTSCVKDKCETTRTYVRYNPVIKNLTEIRDFKVLPAQQIQAYGKIWLYGTYLLVNEPKKGIHIYDNSNPSSPQALSFIQIPGNVDMAVRDNMLYADNYIDLLVIDIYDPQNPKLQKRMENSFEFYELSNQKDLIVDYEEEMVTEVYEEDDCNGGGGFWGGREETLLDNSSGGSPGSGGMPSMGGSMARFALYQDFLYIISNQRSLVSYEISTPSDPLKRDVSNMGWGMETLFPYKDKLFVGASAGMYIYDLKNPSKPVYLTQFRHAQACDPVVVENDIAYVTLRDGTRCNGFANQMDVVDVKDIMNPQLLKSYPMHNPHGLGIDNGTLFLCDGTEGLKVFDAADIYKISDNQIGHYTGMETYDVIPYNNNLILTSKSGIYQYDYSDPKNLKLLSKITI
ncbi:MAG: LVIVD repeat-containing protein [Bacteroidia bacterium]